MAKGILDGIRAISLGSAWAGPYVGRVLAELGAEVFRVEFPGAEMARALRRDPEIMEAFGKKLLEKGMSPEDIEKVARPDPGYVGNYHPNNYNVGLDLRNEKAKEIYKQLAKITDIVIDGFSPRVMVDFGLGYSALKELKADIIYVSIPGLGMTGPEKDVRMWGTGCEFLGGLTSIRGYRDGPPHRAAGFIVDGISSPHILTAILAALNYREETGKGQQIDIAQAECGTSIMAEAIMDYSINRRITKPTGNLHPCYAPHNAYRCRGDDAWVTIAVTSEEEWQCFCDAIGSPQWTEDPKFGDMLSRWKNQEELDRLVEQWTIEHDHYAVQEILQQAGVAAAAVVNLEEHIMYDPQVKDRDIYHWLPFHDGVADPVFRVPWVLPKNPTSLNWCGPHTGQHNDHLLRETLGMSEEEVARLAEEKVIGVTPPMTI